MARPIVEVDALKVYNRNPYGVTVRCRNVWRLQVALIVLQCATFVARSLGVGIRVSVRKGDVS